MDIALGVALIDLVVVAIIAVAAVIVWGKGRR